MTREQVLEVVREPEISYDAKRGCRISRVGKLAVCWKEHVVISVLIGGYETYQRPPLRAATARRAMAL